MEGTGVTEAPAVAEGTAAAEGAGVEAPSTPAAAPAAPDELETDGAPTEAPTATDVEGGMVAEAGAEGGAGVVADASAAISVDLPSADA